MLIISPRNCIGFWITVRPTLGMRHRHLHALLILILCGLASSADKATIEKHGDLFFLDEPQADPREGSTPDDEFGDLDHSSGKGVDDEDAPGSGFGPEEDTDDVGSGGAPEVPRIATVPDIYRPSSTTTTTTKKPHLLPVPPGAEDVRPRLNLPAPAPSAPPEHENRIPEVPDFDLQETSTKKFNINGESSSPTQGTEGNNMSNEVIMGQKQDDRASSFFSRPGILAAVVGGAVVGLLCAILLVMFIVYRMRKKDEGSYALDEPKRSPTVNSYTRSTNKEFYA